MIPLFDVRSLPSPILILAPHPDDEVLATGGLIQLAQRSKKEVYILYVTAGDANEQSVTDFFHEPLLQSGFQKLGNVRHEEASIAMRYLGVPSSHLFFLGFPDSITRDIVTDPDKTRVHKSPLTHLSHAAYRVAYEVGAPYNRETILRLTCAILDVIQPGTVFVTSSEDTNPDHEATSILLSQAMEVLRIRPLVYSYLVHYPDWPNQIGYLTPPHSLYRSGVTTLTLTAEQVDCVRQAFTLMPSQSSLGDYYYHFIRYNELFWKTSYSNW